MKTEFECPADFLATLADKSLEELNMIQDGLTKERWLNKAKARAVARLRHQISSEEDAGAHGLTVEEYQAVKAKAKELNIPTTKAIAEARRGAAKERALQAAQVKQATLGAQVKKSG